MSATAERPTAEWEHFAPGPVRPPGRPGRLRRFLGHEWTVASVCALGLSTLLNRGVLANPSGTLPADTGDPALVSYIMAWTGHALKTDPGNLWHYPAFYPSPYGLAFSDSLLGYAAFGMIGDGVEAAVLRYNIVYILAGALTLVGGYALARQLGLGRLGASVVAAGFAFAPWRIDQAGHLHVLSTGGMLLALAMLARGHGIRFGRVARGDSGDAAFAKRPRYRPGWTLAGWLVAAWQLSIGFAVGLPFAYLLLGCCVVALLIWAARRRRLPPVRLMVADAAGGLVFAAAAALLARPYLKVLDLYPWARRDAAWVSLYSPTWRGLFTAPKNSLIWGDVHAVNRADFDVPAEMSLLPGFALIALALAGLFFSVWSLWVRLALVLGVAASAVLALGTNGPGQGRWGYLLLLDNLPGFAGIRTPGRLIVWATLGLALLAGGLLADLVRRAREFAQHRGQLRPGPLLRLALLIPLVLIFIEGRDEIPVATVPDPPPTLSSVADPYLVLPSTDATDVLVMLWSVDRFAFVANGHAGVYPDELSRIRARTETFPDADSVALLRSYGIKTVVVPDALAQGSPWQDAANRPIAGLGIDREITADAVVFHLAP